MVQGTNVFNLASRRPEQLGLSVAVRIAISSGVILTSFWSASCSKGETGGVVEQADFSVAGVGLTPPLNAADADFAARCNAPSVTKCVGFDTMGTYGNADVVRMDVDRKNGNLRARSDGQYRGAIYTALTKSGGGSIRFQLDAGYPAANI